MSIVNIFLSSLMVGSSLFLLTPDNGEEIVLVNDNKVEISKENYSKLENIGFSEKEILELEAEKYHQLTSMHIIGTKVYYSEILDDDVVEIIGKDDIDNKPNRIIGKDFFEATIDGGGGGDSSKTYYDSDGTKKMTTYVTYYSTTNNNYEIYVKQNVEWTTTPKKRMRDIISLSYTDNLRVKEVGGYPDAQLNYSYKVTNYDANGSLSNSYYSEKNFTSRDKEFYNHKIGDYSAFQFDLMSDQGIPPIMQKEGLGLEYIYSDFNITMETRLETNFPNMPGTELMSHYVHQTGSGRIDWGKLTFTISEPYISYETKIFINDPTFEEALYNFVNLEF